MTNMDRISVLNLEKTLSVKDNCIVLTDTLSIEWKSVAGVVPVTAEPVDVKGVSGVLLRTSPGSGWVRLHLKAGAPLTGVLAPRFIMRIDQKSPTTQIKPFVTKTNTEVDTRRQFSSAPASVLTLKTHKWYEISGAYLHAPIGGRFRLDVVIDLPRTAEILVLDASLGRFDAAITGAAIHGIVDTEVQPIEVFSAKPITNLSSTLNTPTVYAKSLCISHSKLTGWVLSDTNSLFWRDQTTGQEGVVDSGKVDVDFSPPLEDDSIVLLSSSNKATKPIWIGAPTQHQFNGEPVASFFDITRALIEDYQLKVEGSVRHPLYRGMPVRLDLLRGRDVISSSIAKSPTMTSKGGQSDDTYNFHFSIPLRPRDTESIFWLAFSGIPQSPWFWLELTDSSRPQHAKKPKEFPPLMPVDGNVKGQVDGWSAKAINGWAVCPTEVESPIELVLFRDGEPFSYTKTSSYRADIKNIFGGLGFNGFHFEIPPNAIVLQETKFEVRSVQSDAPLKKGTTQLELPAGISGSALLPAPRAWVSKKGGEVQTNLRISVIVLNLNGAELLEEMFASCAPDDMSGNIEWLVVDHNSTDDSQEVCKRFRGQGADIRFLARRGNYSFSESNNYGVRHATGDILLFANNDLIFEQGFGARLREYLRCPEIGALGVRLLDHIDDPLFKDLKIDQHIGVYFESRTTPQGWIRPFEARRCTETNSGNTATRCVAVTGAFLAMRKSNFEAIEGFDERYSYGLEDIDLCLKVQSILELQVVCANDIEVIHHRGFSRRKDKDSGLRRRRNNEIFTGLWGGKLRRMVKQTALTDPGYVTGSRPVFAFMVADVGDETAAGEYYTSLEMGRALQKVLPCHVRYVPESDWYDLTGIDVVVAMVNRFDISKATNGSPWLITVNWMRQWFDRWADDKSVFAYDYLFASSPSACDYLEEKIERKVHLLPIASSYHDFANAEPREEWRCDYAFTGSRFGPPREIEFQLEPNQIEGDGKVFGYNWDETKFSELSQGPVAYSNIPQVYASSRVVLDDGNVATKPWGSCNSRVFDTMASGALLLSNSALGCEELFDDLVPTFDDVQSLTETLNYWLANEDLRKARSVKMQEVIRTKHTYDVRAREMLNQLTTGLAPIRIAIKCAAIYSERPQWGDYHYAESLAAALRRLGYVARVDCRESWYSGLSESDDVTITLRGLIRYKPKGHQINLLWLISHPDDVGIAEIKEFDHSYVASEFHVSILSELVPDKVEFMPQCTDSKRFYFDEDDINTQPGRNLYVANSRGIFRDPVRWAVQDELDLDIYGVGWEPFVTDSRLQGGVIPNSVLGSVYSSSRLVICDHWDDMKALGYASNRVFDVLGAGGRLVVDSVRGFENLVPAEYVNIFETREEFSEIINGPDWVNLDQRREAAEWTAKYHSFDARAAVISERLTQALGASTAGADPIAVLLHRPT